MTAMKERSLGLGPKNLCQCVTDSDSSLQHLPGRNFFLRSHPSARSPLEAEEASLRQRVHFSLVPHVGPRVLAKVLSRKVLLVFC